MDLDSAILWYATRAAKTHDALKKMGVTRRQLNGVAKQAWDFLDEYRDEHGDVPPAGIIAKQFDVPVFPPEEDEEDGVTVAHTYVVDELFKRHQYNSLLYGTKQIKENLKEGEQDEAVAALYETAEALKRIRGRPVDRDADVDGLIECLFAGWDKHQLGLEIPGMAKLTDAICGVRGYVSVCGPPRIGKTSLARQIVTSIVEAKEDVAAIIVTLEMTPDDLRRDMLAQWAGLTSRELHLGPPNGKYDQADGMKELVREQASRLKKLQERLTFIGRQDKVSVESVVQAADEIKARTGATKAIVLVDSLNTWQPEEKAVSDLRLDDLRVEDMLRLKDAIGADSSSENAVITINEIRKSDKNKKWAVTDLSDLKGSGSAAYKPDIVISVAEYVPQSSDKEEQERIEKQRAEREVNGKVWDEIIVLKARRPGRSARIRATFDIARCEFMENAIERKSPSKWRKDQDKVPEKPWGRPLFGGQA